MNKPNVVLVKFRINDRRASELIAQGLKYHERTELQDAQIRQRQKDEALKLGATFVEGRIDAAGTVRGDSGKPMFPDYPKNTLPNVCLKQTVEDLQNNLGMVLTGCNLFKKSGDRIMNFLVLKFEPQGQRFQFNAHQQPLIDAAVGRLYENMQGWFNPDGSWTFNAAHAKDDLSATVYDVHVDVDGVREETRKR